MPRKKTATAVKSEMSKYIDTYDLPKKPEIVLDSDDFRDPDSHSVRVCGRWKLPSTGYANVCAYYHKGDQKLDTGWVDAAISWMKLTQKAATTLRSTGVPFSEPLRVGKTWQLLSRYTKSHGGPQTPKEFAQKVIRPFLIRK